VIAVNFHVIVSIHDTYSREASLQQRHEWVKQRILDTEEQAQRKGQKREGRDVLVTVGVNLDLGESIGRSQN